MVQPPQLTSPRDEKFGPILRRILEDLQPFEGGDIPWRSTRNLACEIDIVALMVCRLKAARRRIP